jgi:hypothetical protein
MVVAALRQRRIAHLVCETKNRPAKTGRFLFRRNQFGATTHGRRLAKVNSGDQAMRRSICETR